MCLPVREEPAQPSVNAVFAELLCIMEGLQPRGLCPSGTRFLVYSIDRFVGEKFAFPHTGVVVVSKHAWARQEQEFLGFPTKLHVVENAGAS